MAENDYSLEFINSLMQDKTEKQITEYIFQGLEDDEIIKKLISQNKTKGSK